MNDSAFRPTVAIINQARLKQNFLNLRALVPSASFFSPMVKANAYGHGDVGVARALRAAGCEHLGVALIEEGLNLRASGDKDSVLVFGPFDKSGAVAMLQNNLTLVLNDHAQLKHLDEAIQEFEPAKTVGIHFEFNSGMNRLGFEPAEAPTLREWLDRHSSVELEGICTHLLRGDDAGALEGESVRQLDVFAKVLNSFGGLSFSAHVLNSSASVNLAARLNEKKPIAENAQIPYGARPGIALYGVQPSNDEHVSASVEPVLTWKTKITNLHHVKKDARVSYGPSWFAKRDSLIGVVPVGYADGYARTLSNRGSVLCRGRRAPVAGTVCMDYFMIDLTDVAAAETKEIKIGEEIVLLGEQVGKQAGKPTAEQITADELAQLTGTIPYEILTSISARVPRIFA